MGVTSRVEQRASWLSTALLPVLGLAAIGCTSPNPEYCVSDQECIERDPTKPYCDIEGRYPAAGGKNNFCIPTPATDAGPDSAATVDQGMADQGADGAVADAPVADAPVADAPVADAPVADAPVADAPVADASVPRLQTTATEQQFGEVSEGATSSLVMISLSNDGQTPTGTIETKLGGTDAAEFVVVEDSCGGAILDEGQTCELQLRMAPEAAGDKRATLTLSANPGGSTTIELSGTALEAASLRLKTTQLDFGIVADGARSEAQVFSLRNEGGVKTGPITVNFDQEDHFAIRRNDCGAPLDPGATCDVQVVFAPQAAGAHQSTLIVEADPGGRSTAALSGTGKVNVTVTLGGTGQGTVTSDPPGLNCGTTCSVDFTNDTVTLQPEAKGESCFMGWSGACSGTRACKIALDQIKTVSANFNEPVPLFTLQTTAVGAGQPFDPEVVKSGCPITWDFGDGARETANKVSHIYAKTGVKTVTALSADGASGVTVLRASGDNLTGAIPESLVGLLNLTTLDLGSNQLTGSIPVALGNLTNLGNLYLNGNRLTGVIPAKLGNLGNVTWLFLDGNDLTGPIPSELGNLANLKILRLTHNKLTGPIPGKLGNLGNLDSLFLEANDLTGPLPAALGNLVNLTQLKLSNNKLTGPIPAELGNLANLTTLDLRSNELTGPIPAELGELTNLTFLSFGSNKLTGPIPAELGNLANLTTLILRSNELTGPIPAALGNLAELTGLYLGQNQLIGAIPAALGTLPSLSYLELHENQLTGAIPAELANLAKLWRLHLHANELSGAEHVVGKLSKLTDVRLDQSGLTEGEVDAVIEEIYQQRDRFDNTRAKELRLGGATNSAPSQAASEKVKTLEKDYKWYIYCNGGC